MMMMMSLAVSVAEASAGRRLDGPEPRAQLRRGGGALLEQRVQDRALVGVRQRLAAPDQRAGEARVAGQRRGGLDIGQGAVADRAVLSAEPFGDAVADVGVAHVALHEPPGVALAGIADARVAHLGMRQPPNGAPSLQQLCKKKNPVR